MNRPTRLLLAGAMCLASTTLGCGDDSSSGATCGEGTTLVDGVCTADPAPTCGTGTTLVNGACVADGGATCGPGTKLEGETCVLDTAAPGPVTGLTAAVSGSNINLSWTAGAGAAGSLVVRLVSGAADAPEAGKAYAVGAMLPGGAQVIAVGAATTFADAFTVPGRYSYMVWSINANGTYGFGREVAAATPLPAQTGAASLDLTATTATVTTQPGRVALALANLAFNTDTATVDLTITNNTAGPLFSPRVIATSVSVGALTNTSGTTAGGAPFVLAGAGALLPGQTRTVTLTVNGLTSTDTVALGLEVAESGFVISGGNAMAASGGGAFQIDLPGVNGNRQRVAIFTDGVFSPSGRYYYGLTRWSESLFRIDTSSGDVTSVSSSAANAGAGACVTLGDDGFAYATAQIGHHRSGSGDAFSVSRIDLASMTSLATTSLTPGTRDQTSGCAYHGHRLAIGRGRAVFFFDTSTMAFTDTDAGTPETIDPVTVTNEAKSLAFNPGGTALYVASSGNQRVIEQIDAANVVTTYHTTTVSQPYSLTVDAAGVLWFGQTDGLYSFDGTTETKLANLTRNIRAIGAISGTTAKLSDYNELFTVDLTTGEVTEPSTLDNTDRAGHRYTWVK